jgi:hypothetical protein
MLFLSGSLLFYTAIIVPVQICLWSYDDPCNTFTTLYFDVIVDTFFLVKATSNARAFPRCLWPAGFFLTSSFRSFIQVEAFTQFFLGYFEEDMTYQDDFLVSLRKNLSSISGFWFDCVTSIPWSYIDLNFYLVRCRAHGCGLLCYSS